MLKIWGRANSVNVQKVMWCLDELGLPSERIDAGMAFGRNTEPGYLALNPNGRVPLLQDGAFHLWESNAIMRYLVRQYAPGSPLYPAAPQPRSSVDRWLDWTLSTLQPAERDLFWGYIRTAPAERDQKRLDQAAAAAAKLWAMVDRHLEHTSALEAGTFTLADIALGSYARRWFGLPIAIPPMPRLQRWYAGLERRPAFQRIIAPALS